MISFVFKTHNFENSSNLVKFRRLQRIRHIAENFFWLFIFFWLNNHNFGSVVKSLFTLTKRRARHRLNLHKSKWLIFSFKLLLWVPLHIADGLNSQWRSIFRLSRCHFYSGFCAVFLNDHHISILNELYFCWSFSATQHVFVDCNCFRLDRKIFDI